MTEVKNNPQYNTSLLVTEIYLKLVYDDAVSLLYLMTMLIFSKCIYSLCHFNSFLSVCMLNYFIQIILHLD